MNEQKGFVFVGGPKDGIRLVLKEAEAVVYFDELVGKETSIDLHTDRFQQMQIRLVKYLLASIRINDKKFHFYYYASMTKEKAIEALILGYKIPPDDSDKSR